MMPIYRSHYGAACAEGRALADLLRDVFELDLGPLADFGGWDPSATPFSYFDDDGRCAIAIRSSTV